VKFMKYFKGAQTIKKFGNLCLLYRPSSSTSRPVLRLQNKQFPFLATVLTDNASIMIYFPLFCF
jgi:hypothetical protein